MVHSLAEQSFVKSKDAGFVEVKTLHCLIRQCLYFQVHLQTKGIKNVQ